MHPTIIHALRGFIADYGYWALALLLLSESAGLPVPGEMALLLASGLAYSEHQLHLGWIIVVAICATTLGGNLGYAVGLHGGRPLLDRYQRFFRIPPTALARGERMFARYGAAAIFFARFVVGMRVLAGPLAGVLRMKSRAFAIFNFLGAAVWVTVIASVGYLFAQQWRTVLHVLHRFNIAVVIAAGALALLLWWRYRRHPPPDND